MLSKKQMKFKVCPDCGSSLYEVETESETFLHCSGCFVCIDSDGGKLIKTLTIFLC